MENGDRSIEKGNTRERKIKKKYKFEAKKIK